MLSAIRKEAIFSVALKNKCYDTLLTRELNEPLFWQM